MNVLPQNRAVRRATVAVAAAAVVAVYFFFNPADESLSRYFPKCVFRSLTGYSCPGCGTQRAFSAALHGNWRDALRYNAFLAVALPVIALYLADWLTHHRLKRLSAVLNHPATVIALVTTVIAWWIARNILSL